MAAKYPSLNDIHMCGGDCDKLDAKIQQHQKVVESLRLWHRMMMFGEMTIERYNYLEGSVKNSIGYVGVIS